MLSVTILCIGKLKEKYWREACEEYAKRLGAFCKFRIVEFSESRLPERPSDAQIAEALDMEGEKILEAAKGSFLIPLCIEGRELSSPKLAEGIQQATVGGASAISFAIGSSFGLSDGVKQSGNFCLSMSPMTFPHQLARVMLCEQVYRTFQIMNHGKYHK
ncbi:MAG: 23S rRNA (pseudouridine(1915)-N(3))-methyltransferase RlmH [Clostridiales bacterium]|nr:23S rRNA (pseudouridine(1915)-N(3))-methyltransferase RlmH [Clostridiales bacterium]